MGLTRACRIVSTILFVFVMHRVEAQVPQQSPRSLDWGRATGKEALRARLIGTQSAVQSAGSSHAPPQMELRRFSLSSGVSIEVSSEWIEREQIPLPPSPRLAPFAPQVTFLEFAALENPKMHSVLRIATTTNPFLGDDETTLEARMHGAAGSGNGLADYLFYFFFSPPRDCLDGGSEAYRNAKSQAEMPDQAVFPGLRVPMYCKYAPSLADFYSRELSPGVVYEFTSTGVERASGIYPEFYLAPMEKVEENGLTFYVFEAQGRTPLDLATVEHFNFPDEMQGAQADFFLAVGAPSPFPFFLDPQRKNVQVIEVSYAGIGLGPNKRDIFLRLLGQVHSP
jgi:hypothetical protein